MTDNEAMRLLRQCIATHQGVGQDHFVFLEALNTIMVRLKNIEEKKLTKITDKGE